MKQLITHINLFYRFVFWSFILFVSLNIQAQNPLLGKWIETNAKEIPMQINFHSYYFVLENPYGRKDSIVYHLRNDTLIFSENKRIAKVIFSLKNDELKLYENANRFMMQLKRNNYKNIVGYYNERYQTSIALPRIEEKLKKLKYEYPFKTYLVQYDEQKNIEFIVDGKKYNLKSISDDYLSTGKSFTELEKEHAYNYFFIDKNIKVSGLQIIKNKFRKAEVYNFCYIYEAGDEQLYEADIRLRRFSDSLDSLLLKQVDNNLSIRVHTNNSKNFDLLLTKISAEKMLLNGKKIEEKEWLKLIQNRLLKKDNFVVLVHYDEQMSYGEYLKKLVQLKNIFEQARNAYAREKYQIADYHDGGFEIVDEVRKIYPFYYKEVNPYEYERVAFYLKNKKH